VDFTMIDFPEKENLVCQVIDTALWVVEDIANYTKSVVDTYGESMSMRYVHKWVPVDIKLKEIEAGVLLNMCAELLGIDWEETNE